MKFIDKNDFNGLAKELEVISGKKFTGDQFDRLAAGFGKIDWNKACQIVRDFERLERFPTNIYGVIANRVEDAARERIQSAHKREQREAGADDRASSEEFNLWNAIIDEAKVWILSGLDAYNAKFEHIRDLPPPGQKCQSWSAAVNYAVDKWIEFESRVRISTPKQRCELLKNVLDLCKKEREERLTKKKVEEVRA